MSVIASLRLIVFVDVNKKMTLHFHTQHIKNWGISAKRMGGCTRSLISLKKKARLYFQTLVSAQNKSSHYPWPLLQQAPYMNARTHARKYTSHKHMQLVLQMVVQETVKGNEGNLQSPVTALPENRWLENKTYTQTHPHTTRVSKNGEEEHL